MNASRIQVAQQIADIWHEDKYKPKRRVVDVVFLGGRDEPVRIEFDTGFAIAVVGKWAADLWKAHDR